MNKKEKGYYLDNASNTPLDRRVLSAMKPYLSEKFVGNSHSTHDFGVFASQAIELSRVKIATATGFKPNEIYFTSGATESNNWVLKSLALHELHKENNPKLHLVVSAIEHASIMNTCKELESWGFNITYVKPDSHGVVTAKRVRAALRFNTLLVCIMAVNNETGVANPINSIGMIAHQNKTLMMSDCTQLLSYGSTVSKMKSKYSFVDYFTFSGHKIYGPTGTGCLIARATAPLYPFISGGGQERGLRGGTSNTAGIVGLGEAVSLIASTDYSKFFEQLYDYLIDQLTKNKIPFLLNAVPDHKNIVSLNLSKFMNDTDLASLFANYGIAVSAGSACEASSDGIETKPSHVLTALGVSEQEAHNTIRVSFSRYTTKKDIDALVKVIIKLLPKEGNE